MELKKIFCSSLKHLIGLRRVKTCCCSSFSLNDYKNYSTQKLKAEELLVQEKIQITKPSVKKWKRPPFVKNLFMGKYDTELCAFPEILDKEQLAEVEHSVRSINSVFTEKVNSTQIDEEKSIPEEVLQDLKDLGLFGRMIPVKYGGLDLTYTASTRISEALGLDWSVYSSIAAHEFLATQVILLFGSEEQKMKYLPGLTSGKHIAAFCCSEFKSGSDLLSMSTTADKTPDGSFIISGTKSWVTNADSANIFIVFAKTKNPQSNKNDDISVFIVERDQEDLTVTTREKTCLRGCQTGDVKFREIVIPSENLIGAMGSGFQIYLKVVDQFRFFLNSYTFGALKLLLDSVTEDIIHSERIERSLGDIQLVRRRLSNISSVIYAMESVSYFTAAILDSTENPDITLETAIVKVFNSEGTLYCLRELINAAGSSSFMKQHQLERFYRDAQGLAMFDGSNDIARLYIGLSGCKYVGSKTAEKIVKQRNPFFFPQDRIKEKIRKTRIQHNWFKYYQDIAGHLHPSLVEWGNNLEEKLQKFEVAVDEVLTDHGAKVVETQIEPSKLADIAIDLYVMAAVLSRASRSYCIGLKNAQHEIRLASSFCHDANVRIFRTLAEIFTGMSYNNEGSHLLLGEQVIDCRGYFAEHPLKHNF